MRTICTAPALSRSDHLAKEFFYRTHDPTTVNRQGADTGTSNGPNQYVVPLSGLALRRTAVESGGSSCSRHEIRQETLHILASERSGINMRSLSLIHLLTAAA